MPQTAVEACLVKCKF